MCGKYLSRRLLVLVLLGSPPHVREIQHDRKRKAAAKRITPACAGNTQMVLNHLKNNKDHPRMCGKYKAVGFLADFCAGSPPHVREILLFEVSVDFSYRITPACAGNTQRKA